MGAVILLLCMIQNLYALPNYAPNIQYHSTSINEGQTMKLSCYISSPGTDPITWSWYCGNENLTANSTSRGGYSALSFVTNRRHDKEFCHCRAEARNSLGETYDKNSRFIQIRIIYTPSTPPKLNVSDITLHQGEEATLGCSIDYLGNPPITWSWTCGTRGIHKRLQINGRTTSVVITAEPDMNGKSCYCSCTSYHYNRFQLVSESALITVFYNPPDHPRINTGAIKVTDGSRVSLQCYLSTTGNPPIIWSWYCNDVVVTENVSHRGKTTEIFFFATKADNSKECYCRAQGSLTISGILYDKNSSTSFITVSDQGTLTVQQTENGYNGLSSDAIWVIFTILLVTLGFCSVVIFVQNRRRICKKSSFMDNRGKQSSSHCKFPVVRFGSTQSSEKEFESEEPKYEELHEGITTSRINESHSTYQNSQSRHQNQVNHM